VSSSYLGREDAPFGQAFWELLEKTAIAVAKSELAGRRILPLEGPFGLGFTFVPFGAKPLEEGVLVAGGQPLVALEQTFSLRKLDIAQFERNGVALDLAPLVAAVKNIAHLEERLIFEGFGDYRGLCTASGVLESSLSSWDEPGKAAEDLIRAVSLLDSEGFHGPFALALSPGRYNLLLRRYPETAQIELDHIRTIVGDRVVKAPYLKEGGVLLAVNPVYARILLGQDLEVGFIGPDKEGYLFSVSESLTLLLTEPRSVCVLR
jgi:uncharacterized linocin/CFP29 family protein